MNVLYACQTCGKAIPKDLRWETLQESEWKFQRISLGTEFVLELLLCPRCLKFDPVFNLDRYKNRIRTGLEIRYH